MIEPKGKDCALTPIKLCQDCTLKKGNSLAGTNMIPSERMFSVLNYLGQLLGVSLVDQRR